jgi:hypothetical protein
MEKLHVTTEEKLAKIFLFVCLMHRTKIEETGW